MKQEKLKPSERTRRRYVDGAAHPVLYPNASSFADLFFAHDEIHDLRGYKSHDAHVWHGEDWDGRYGKMRPAEMRLSSYAGLSGAGGDRRSFDVNAKPEIVERIGREMLFIGWDTLNFELIRWKGGLTLVTVHHSKIIGSRWLALIRTNTIPGEQGLRTKRAS